MVRACVTALCAFAFALRGLGAGGSSVKGKLCNSSASSNCYEYPLTALSPAGNALGGGLGEASPPPIPCRPFGGCGRWAVVAGSTAGVAPTRQSLIAFALRCDQRSRTHLPAGFRVDKLGRGQGRPPVETERHQTDTTALMSLFFCALSTSFNHSTWERS